MFEIASQNVSSFGARRRLRGLLIIGFAVLSVSALLAETPPVAPKREAPDFRKGALYGKVTDIVTGKPILGATVALQDKEGKVVVWSTTNAQGEYALAADPMTALHLRPSRRRGLLEQICRTVGNVITAPVKVVGAAVANPGKTLGAAVTSVATGTPAPLAAEAIAPAIANPGQTKNDTQQQAREAAVKTAVGQTPRQPQTRPEKGEALIMVSAPNYKNVAGKTGAYWLEPPQKEGEKECGMQAWLETAQLAPAASDKASVLAQEALLLTEAQADPALTSAGERIKLRVKLQAPVGPSRAVRLFAREDNKNVVAELAPGTGANSNVFEGALRLDPKTPIGETTITIAALRAEPVEVRLDKKKPDPLVEFVRRLDDMRPNKPYEYDPRIMASENRLDIKLQILDPKKGTQTPATTPSAPGANPADKPSAGDKK